MESGSWFESTEQELIARARISDTLARWARAIDRRDWEAIRDVFHDGATDDHGPYRGDVDGLIAWLADRHEPVVQSMHFLGSTLIEFRSAVIADVETQVIAIQRHSASSPVPAALVPGASEAGRQADVHAIARYLDRFTLRDGNWRIEQRRTVFETIATRPVTNEASLPAEWLVATRDRDDPVYASPPKLERN